eukprot:3065047-Rhodomonas_salina.1
MEDVSGVAMCMRAEARRHSNGQRNARRKCAGRKCAQTAVTTRGPSKDASNQTGKRKGRFLADQQQESRNLQHRRQRMLLVFDFGNF